MSNALEISEAIVNLLKYWVDGESNILKDALIDETGVYVATAQAYTVGDVVALTNGEKIEMHEVSCITKDDDGFPIILFDEPLTCTWSKDETTLHHIYGGQLINEIFLSDPNTVTKPPCLTVEVTEENQEPFTLGSVKETYHFAITCHVSGSESEESFKHLLRLTYAVKKALMKQIYPLIEPYKVIDIVEDVMRDDVLIKVEPTDGLNGANEVLLFDEFDRLRPNAVAKHLGNGVVELKFAVGLDYPKFAVRPFTNTFDPRVESIAYNTQSDNDLIVRKSIVQYSISCMKERRC